MAFPSSIWSPTPAVDAVDTVDAVFINDPQTEIEAIEASLGADPRLYVSLVVFDFTVPVIIGDGAIFFHVPARMDNMDIVELHAEVITAGTTGTLSIQVYNVNNALDLVDTHLQIDSGETGSDTAAIAYAINTGTDHINENDVLRVDIDGVQTIEPLGLIVTLGFS